MVELRILKGKNQTNQSLRFRTDFSLFRDLIGEIIWNTVLEREIQESWLIFKITYSKLAHPDKQKDKEKWQEACLNEQSAPAKRNRH